MSELSDIEARLRAVEDRLEIIEVEAMYARTFDSRRGDDWAALFIEDGIYQARGATSSGGGSFVRGRQALARFCNEAPFAGLHLMHLPQVSFDGDRATARTHLEFIGLFDDTGAPVTRMDGYYDVAYQRIDGRWLIERRVTTTFARISTASFGYPPASGLDASA